MGGHVIDSSLHAHKPWVPAPLPTTIVKFIKTEVIISDVKFCVSGDIGPAIFKRSGDEASLTTHGSLFFVVPFFKERQCDV